MTRRHLGYGRQSIDQADIDAVVAVLQGDFLTQGPAVERFEAALAERSGARYAVAVGNGTAALHLACLAAGIGMGNLGVTSAITFAASANCLRYAGAEAGFVDIDPHTVCMSPAALKQALASRPEIKVVIPVHLGGLANDAAAIRAVVGDRVVIEDGAQSFGAEYEPGKPVGCGAYADMTTFSFHPVKTITTGEGGAIVCNDSDLAHRLRMLRTHGMERDPARFAATDAIEDGRVKPWFHEQQVLGFNYRMTDLQAALGLSQLAKLDEFLRRRRDIAARYDAAFAALPHLRLPQAKPEERARSALHLYLAVFDFEALGTTRTAFMTRLNEAGVGSQVHYIPVYRHPYYAQRYGVDPALFPAAETYYRGCLSLPLFPGMTDEDVEHVVATVREAAGAA
jgi:UDP-4-amino-4,6-dideoxy-N-acetyl-beta-L-altrosamine transaminase